MQLTAGKFKNAHVYMFPGSRARFWSQQTYAGNVRACSSENIADLPQDVLGCIFSHLPLFWLRSARCTCRSFRSASIPLIRTLSTAVPHIDVQNQLRALSHVTNLTLEVHDWRSAAAVARPNFRTTLRHLKLLSVPRIRTGKISDFTALAARLLKPFETGLAAATRLTRLTLENGPFALNVVIPACPLLQELELLRGSWHPMKAEYSQTLRALRLAGNLRTFRCDLWLAGLWGPLLAELAHLPSLCSLGRVQLEDAAALEGLCSLTHLTQLVVKWDHMGVHVGDDMSPTRLSRLFLLRDLELDHGFYGAFEISRHIPGALQALPHLERLHLSGFLYVDIVQAVSGLSCLTALELLYPIRVAAAGSLVQPWTSRLQRLALSLASSYEFDARICENIQRLGSALTNLEHLELRVWSLPAWIVLVPYIWQYTRLTSLILLGPGTCSIDEWRHAQRNHVVSGRVEDEQGRLSAVRLPALGQLSKLTGLTRLRLEKALEAHDVTTDIPAVATLTNLQVRASNFMYGIGFVVHAWLEVHTDMNT